MKYTRTGKPRCNRCQKLAVQTQVACYSYMVEDGIVVAVRPHIVGYCKDCFLLLNLTPSFQVGDKYLSPRERYDAMKTSMF